MPKIVLIILHYTTRAEKINDMLSNISSVNLMQLDLKRSPHMTEVSQSRKHVVA